MLHNFLFSDHSLFPVHKSWAISFTATASQPLPFFYIICTSFWISTSNTVTSDPSVPGMFTRDCPSFNTESLASWENAPPWHEVFSFGRLLGERWKTRATPPKIGTESNTICHVKWVQHRLSAFCQCCHCFFLNHWSWQPWFVVYSNGSLIVASLQVMCLKWATEVDCNHEYINNLFPTLPVD